MRRCQGEGCNFDLDWRWWDPVPQQRRYCDRCAWQREVQKKRRQRGIETGSASRLALSEAAYRHRERQRLANRRRSSARARAARIARAAAE